VLRLLGVPAGAVVALGFPAANLWWLSWVALVPWFALVASASGPGDAAWRCWAAGTGFSFALYHWVLGALGLFAPIPALALGALWIPLGIVVHVAFNRARNATTVWGAVVPLLTVPSAWVLTEFVRSWHVLAGSWGQLGLSQWQVGPVRQLAALGGVWALSWVLVAFNTGLALLVVDRDRPPRHGVAVLVVPVALTVVVVAWGANRVVPDDGERFVVAGVQPGVVVGPAARLAQNERLTDELDPAAAGIDLVVWGQSSVGFDPGTDAEVRDRLEAVTDRARVPVLVNVDARRGDGGISKSSVLFEPDVGMVATYDKQRLVPFGEYIPMRSLLGWLDRFSDAAAEDRVPGGDLTLFRVAGTDVGPLISYESTFPDLRRSLARLGPDVIVVQGASTTFQGSWAQPQQAAGEAIRAVESGRSSALVTVSGTSAAFDANGRRLGWLPADRTGVMIVELPAVAVDTPYVRWGDWVVAGSVVVVVVWLVAAVRLTLVRRRTRRHE